MDEIINLKDFVDEGLIIPTPQRLTQEHILYLKSYADSALKDYVKRGDISHEQISIEFGQYIKSVANKFSIESADRNVFELYRDLIIAKYIYQIKHLKESL